jgi:Co/Zn/Cd efflux system component
MFVVEAAGGVLSSSTALHSDSLDNFGDALTYALSLFVVGRSNEAKARVALECSRNDIASNLAVIVAAFAVAVTGTGWPDLVVAIGLAALSCFRLRASCAAR